MSRYLIASEENLAYLAHHGIQGQKWGIRRFQNEDGSLTEEGRQRYGKYLYKSIKKDFKKNKIDFNSNKKLLKKVLNENDPNLKKLRKIKDEYNKEFAKGAEAYYNFKNSDEYLKAIKNGLDTHEEYAKYVEKYYDFPKKVEKLSDKLDKEIEDYAKYALGEYGSKRLRNGQNIEDSFKRMMRYAY